jgi:hypothetical protein
MNPSKKKIGFSFFQSQDAIEKVREALAFA